MERLPPGARPLDDDAPESSLRFDHVVSVVAGDTAFAGADKARRRSSRRIRRLGVIYTGIGLVGRHRRLGPLADGVEREIDRIVSENAPEHVFVHAGAVAWGGRALLLPGESGSGKTTLVTELVRLGATYLSDDYAVLDFDGRVHPYPRPPRLRDRDPDAVAADVLEDLGGPVARPDDGPYPVGWILELPRSEDGGLEVRPLPGHGRGVLSLLRHAIPARDGPSRCLDAVTRAAETAEAFGGRRGEAAEAAAWIVRSLLADGEQRVPGSAGAAA